MKMMKKLTSCLLLAAGLMTWTGCASDDSVEEHPSTVGKTAFMMNETAKAGAKSRTAGTHTGTQLDFYWTAGDNLWLNDPLPSPHLVGSASSDIAEHLSPTVKKVATAKFWFEGEYNAPSYEVRYTGTQSTAGDKVRISPEQEQTLPAQPTRIGEYGDCGTATANRNGDHYDFTLDHKAGYITFVPFCSTGGGNVKLTQIKVSSTNTAEPMAGTFDFTDAGINIAVWPLNQAYGITLRTLGTDGTGFTLPTSANYAATSCTMVLAPRTYTGLTVEYMVDHPISHIPSPVQKTYSNVMITPGKNKKLVYDVPRTIVSGVRYLFQDGTTGTIAQKGTRTPIAIVVVDKTATEDGLAIALKDDYGAGLSVLPWGVRNGTTQQYNNVVKATVTDVIADMDGYKYTWEAAGSHDGVMVKANDPTMEAFYKAANHTSPAPITFGGGKRGKWFLPSVGQWVLALKVLGKNTTLPTDLRSSGTSATKGDVDITYMNSLFTATGVGGEALHDYWYWASTQYHTLEACSIDFVDGGPNSFQFTSEPTGIVGENVRAFIYF